MARTKPAQENCSIKISSLFFCRICTTAAGRTKIYTACWCSLVVASTEGGIGVRCFRVGGVALLGGEGLALPKLAQTKQAVLHLHQIAALYRTVVQCR